MNKVDSAMYRFQRCSDLSALRHPFQKVVGFFSNAGEMEEDEMQDFMEAAIDLQPRSDVYFGVVDDAAICTHFKQLQWIHASSEAVLTRREK